MPTGDLMRKIFRAQRSSSQAQSATTQPRLQPTAPTTTHSVSSPANLPATSTAAPTNPALELAIERQFKKVPDAEKEAFRESAKTMDEKNLLSMAQSYDEQHQQSSTFRPQAERLSKFLGLLDRFMGGVVIGIQSNPEISSIVVGAVRIVIDLALSFVTFFHKLTDMICYFEKYLTLLSDFAMMAHDINMLQEAVAAVYGDLLEFCGKVRRVFVDANAHKRKWTSLRVFLRQQWEPFELEFGSIKENLHDHIELLQLSAQASSFNFARKIDKRKERLDFLDWISQIDFEKVHDEIYAKKHQGTGAWLLKRKEFNDWMSSSQSSLLWCHGKAGAGKSVLASNVLERITAEFALRDEVGISFIYYNYRKSELGDLRVVIGALIKQLCQKKDSIPSKLLNLRHDSHSNSTASNPDTFISLAGPLKEIFIVVDALDECPRRERHRIIGFISKIIAELRCAKVFITSRRETDILEAFGSNTSTIQIEAKSIAADIAVHARDEVTKLRGGYNGKRLYLTSDELQEKVIDTLVSKADGMFLWVNLHLEHLCQISRAKKDQLIEDALDTLPDGLDDTYSRLVEGIVGQSSYMRELALNSLIWTIYAKEPLGIKALQEAIATARNSKIEVDAKIDPVDVILDACSGLLEESGEPWNRTIRPIHFSMQEFFTTSAHTCIQRGSLGFAANPTSAYAELSRVCLIFLQLAPSNLLDLHYNYPFSIHAAQFFDHYVFKCGCPENILPLVDNILSRDDRFLGSLFQLRRMRAHIKQFGSYTRVDEHALPLSASAVIYATQLYEIPSIRIRWAGFLPPKNALHHASSAGLLSAVARLLEQGYDINERDGDDAPPIHYASEDGYDKIIELLLDKGANVNARGGKNGNALQAASNRGHSRTIQLLLDKGADVNAQGGYFGNALQAASNQGYDEIVKLLLDKGAEVNAQGGEYGNALQAVSNQGYDKIVELLLDKGAEVNAQGGEYGDALYAASYQGHDEIVKLLLNKGADINAQGGDYGNALQAASLQGHDEIVKLLLNQGAEVNAQGGFYGNALQAASYGGDDKIVKLLLDKGADVNVQGGRYGNALQAASCGGDDKIVELLLDKGADVNAQDGYFGNALQAASNRGHDEIVKLLLDKGAEVNAQGGRYGNALQAALADGHRQVMKMLLDAGAESRQEEGLVPRPG